MMSYFGMHSILVGREEASLLCLTHSLEFLILYGLPVFKEFT